MNFDDGKLIELVIPNTFIYDKKEPLFKSKEARRNVWNFIGSEMQRKGTECEHRWNILRTRYNTERRELKKPSGSAGGLKRKWPLYDAFGFLDSHLVLKKTKGNINVEESEDIISPVDFVIKDTAEASAVETMSVAAADDLLFSPSTSTSFTDDNIYNEVTPSISVYQEVTPHITELRKQNKRSKNRNDDVNLSNAIENVNSYFKQKAENKSDAENGDMCFAKQIYYNLLDIKNKKKKTEIKIKMLNLFLEAEDSD